MLEWVLVDVWWGKMLVEIGERSLGMGKADESEKKKQHLEQMRSILRQNQE